MTNSRAAQLLKKYQEGRCTPEEKELVEKVYQEVVDPQLGELPQDQLLQLKDNVWQRLEAGLLHVPEPEEAPSGRIWVWRAAAAVLVLAGVTAAYLFINKPAPGSQVAKISVIDDVAPGGNKAVLILGDGSKVNLSDAQNGKLAASANVTKTADGEVVYTAPEQSGVTVYNTISTPKGGQYNITLPDGSKVWLNAASSLKFPTNFATSSRKVELTGEGYFEIAQNPGRPFIVSTIKQTVEVLGTHFNVNAYADEPSVRTTLLSGKVRVRTSHGDKVLSPGQQSVGSETGLQVREADLELTMAWRNGSLRFRDQDLPTVMREVARWYDVTVAFEGKPDSRTYTGYVSRASNLSSFLKILKLSNIEFRLVKEETTGVTKLTIMN